MRLIYCPYALVDNNVNPKVVPNDVGVGGATQSESLGFDTTQQQGKVSKGLEDEDNEWKGEEDDNINEDDDNNGDDDEDSNEDEDDANDEEDNGNDEDEYKKGDEEGNQQENTNDIISHDNDDTRTGNDVLKNANEDRQGDGNDGTTKVLNNSAPNKLNPIVSTPYVMYLYPISTSICCSHQHLCCCVFNCNRIVSIAINVLYLFSFVFKCSSLPRVKVEGPSDTFCYEFFQYRLFCQ